MFAVFGSRTGSNLLLDANRVNLSTALSIVLRTITKYSHEEMSEGRPHGKCFSFYSEKIIMFGSTKEDSILIQSRSFTTLNLNHNIACGKNYCTFTIEVGNQYRHFEICPE